MENIAFRQLKEVVDKSNSIGIVVGKDPSIDQMAAALALYLSFTQSGKNVSIASASQPTVELSSLVGINKVKNNLSTAGGDLVVSFPYKEGEIDKVSYTLENNFLNIIVKAGAQGLSFSERDIQFTKPTGAVELLFVVGTPRLSDLGPLYDVAGLKNATVVNLDCSSENQGFGDIVLVSPKLSSASEIVANVLYSLNFQVNQDIAQNLLNGISSATENFQSSNTSSMAFEMVGNLLKSGATRGGIQSRSHFFRESIQPKQEEKQTQFEQAQNQVQTQQINQQEEKKEENPPEDWLTPKIYKGSTNF